MVVVKQRAAGPLLALSGTPRRCSLPVILHRLAEGDGGGEQRAAGPLLAACGAPGGAIYL
jgi:hypothetical protein